MDFYKIYRPITATPFINNVRHTEIEPCDELKPYIRCFWGSAYPHHIQTKNPAAPSIIIPDTCMDIIFYINHSKNQISSDFCGINDVPFNNIENTSNDLESIFGIRFYAWSVYLFAEDSIKHIKNNFIDINYHFSKLRKKIEPLLFDITNIYDRIKIAENFLINNIKCARNNHIITDAISELLLQKGSLKIKSLEKNIHISSRQLERVFSDNMGISPKQLASLIRYQYLWKDLLNNKTSPLDLVYKYGYTDQAHLLHEFKKYHGMTPEKAKKHAYNVAFLQEKK